MGNGSFFSPWESLTTAIDIILFYLDGCDPLPAKGWTFLWVLWEKKVDPND